MNVLIEQLESCGVIPVIQIDRVDDALPLAEALIEGGLPCAEITFRTPCAAQAIRQISAHYPQMLLGAGTVLTPEQADEAADAGAHFIVSQGSMSPRYATVCKGAMPSYPACVRRAILKGGYRWGSLILNSFPPKPRGALPCSKPCPRHMAAFGLCRPAVSAKINSQNI